VTDIFPVSSPITYDDGTMQPIFRDFLRKLGEVQVNTYTLVSTDDAGDGTVEGDTNASDFTAQGTPPSPGSAFNVLASDVVQFVHKAVLYGYAGPKGVSIGLGGSYVTTASDFIAIGTNDHDLIINRSNPDSHPQAAITGLVAGQGVQDTNITTNASGIATNASGIATNVTDIGTNATNISTNSADFASHINETLTLDPHPQYTLESVALTTFAFAAYGNMNMLSATVGDGISESYRFFPAVKRI